MSPYLAQMWENTDQKNSEHGHFSRIDNVHDSSDMNNNQTTNIRNNNWNKKKGQKCYI